MLTICSCSNGSRPFASHFRWPDSVLGRCMRKKSRLTIPEQSWRRWWWWGAGGGELFGTIIPFTFKKKNTWIYLVFFLTNPSEKSYATVKLHCITSARFSRSLIQKSLSCHHLPPAQSPSFSHNQFSKKLPQGERKVILEIHLFSNFHDCGKKGSKFDETELHTWSPTSRNEAINEFQGQPCGLASSTLKEKAGCIFAGLP